MKLRTDIALEQERVLEKKTQQIATQTEMIKQLEEKVEKLNKELKEVKSELEDARRTIEEKEVVIKKNDNGMAKKNFNALSLIADKNYFDFFFIVINWLNRRLTELSAPATTSSSTSTTARTGSDSLFAMSQTKSNISNLTKGWPPWLANSVAVNNNSQRKEAGMFSSLNIFIYG